MTGLSDGQQALLLGVSIGLTNAAALVSTLPIPQEWKVPLASFFAVMATSIAAIKEKVGGQTPKQ